MEEDTTMFEDDLSAYARKNYRWACIIFMVKLLRVEAELTMFLLEHSLIAERRGQWKGFDKVLNWVNEQEKLSVKKKEVYRAVMEMRPE